MAQYQVACRCAYDGTVETRVKYRSDAAIYAAHDLLYNAAEWQGLRDSVAAGRCLKTIHGFRRNHNLSVSLGQYTVSIHKI